MAINNDDLIKELEGITDVVADAAKYFELADQADAIIQGRSMSYSPITSSLRNANAKLVNLSLRLDENDD